MELDSLVYIFFLSIFFNFFFIKYYKIFFFKKINDIEFKKPQAFHKFPAIRSGGVTILFFLLLFFIFYNKADLLNNYFFSIISLSIIFFIIGFLEDIKISTKPLIRLFFLFFLSSFVLFYFNIEVFKTQVGFLNYIIYSNKIFSVIFACLCLIFIVNGCNFVDGFNGLLIIHSIIILVILYCLNILNSNNLYLQHILLFFIIILTSIFFFNFPKAKIFLGDSGAYLIGVFLSITSIQIANLNPKISPFFFANLLFYVFFEVIFSFFRKIFNERKTPFEPDKKHLHMLIFKILKKKMKNSEKANFSTSLLINFIYFIFIIPNLFFYKDEYFCKTYFFFLIIFYLFFYFFLEKRYFLKN